MAVIYSMPTKAARMLAVRDMMAGGMLELGTANMVIVLASIRLPADCCACLDDCVTASPNEGTYAVGKGRIAAARVRNASGADVVSGLTVGKSGDVLVDYPDVEPGQIVTIAAFRIRHA